MSSEGGVRENLLLFMFSVWICAAEKLQSWSSSLSLTYRIRFLFCMIHSLDNLILPLYASPQFLLYLKQADKDPVSLRSHPSLKAHFLLIGCSSSDFHKPILLCFWRLQKQTVNLLNTYFLCFQRNVLFDLWPFKKKRINGASETFG